MLPGATENWPPPAAGRQRRATVSCRRTPTPQLARLTSAKFGQKCQLPASRPCPTLHPKRLPCTPVITSVPAAARSQIRRTGGAIAQANNHMRSTLIFMVPCLWLAAGQAQDCFRWDGTVNGKPARFMLDTGCSVSQVMLFRPAADRFGLKLQPMEHHNADQITGWSTEGVVRLPGWDWWRGVEITGAIAVCDLPNGLRQIIRVDGVVGWPLICKRITRFDAKSGKFQFLRKVPKEATGWATFTVRTNLAETGQMLALEVPKDDGSKGLIFIDTGAVGDGGIDLAPRLWHQWQHTHPNVLRGLVCSSGGLPPEGLAVKEQAWAGRFSVGALELTDVVLGEVGPACS